MPTIPKFLQVQLLAQRLAATSRKTRVVTGSAVFLALCAFGSAAVAPIAPDASDLPVKAIQLELALPDLSEQVAALGSNQHFISEERIRSGDTLAAILLRLGVSDNAAGKFLRTDDTARAILQLRPGKRVAAEVGADGSLQRLSAIVSGGSDNMPNNLVIARSADGFTAKQSPAALEKRIEMRTGEIRSSLFAATDLAHIPDAIATQIVDMFATEIDFGSDLRRGDRFSVVYETFWQDGEMVRAGKVLAAQFQNDGSNYQSVWFEDPSSKLGGGYYGFDGKSLKKAFLKSPLEFTRISSGFSMRLHPILGKWKQHKGVDFAAAMGTPIRASGDGVIEFSGTQNGYGNMVVIKHWANYSTAYGHMSRFAAGMHKGMKVSQGDVIGYVGMTGWATGPHLHYEFRIADQPRDPMTVDIPNAQPLAAAAMAKFRTVADGMTHRFGLLNPVVPGVQVAAK